MGNERIFCGEGECSYKCPAYDEHSFNSQCKIVGAKIESEKAKTMAHEKMKEYYSLKIEGEK